MASAAYRFNYGHDRPEYRPQTSLEDNRSSNLTSMSNPTMIGDPRGGQQNSLTSRGSLSSSKDSSVSVNRQANQSRCTAARVKTCMKMFFAQLFSHVGLCALVIGYTVMGAAIFVYLERENELMTRNQVGHSRKATLDELYNITGKENGKN